MTVPSKTSRARSAAKIIGISMGTIVFIVVTMMWLMGVFHPKISGKVERATGRPIGTAKLVPVEKISIPVTESAVGTVRPVHEAAIASKILAKVLEVKLKAGDRVKKDDVLVRLDDADLKARRQQAAAAVAAAKAARDHAKTEFERVSQLFNNNAAPKIEFDRGKTALETAEAELNRAEGALNDAETVLGYATIRSPMDGTVVDKRVDVGDTVTPGQVLINLYDPTRMQLVASVRESLTHRLKVGQGIEVTIAALGHPCEGRISEIVPQAESASRSFLVKVTGPCPPGVYAGMFGRLTIPLDDEQILVIPQQAVRTVGQLKMVDVADGQILRRRSVQLGRELDGQMEVLAGLGEGEQVAVPAGMTTASAASMPHS